MVHGVGKNDRCKAEKWSRTAEYPMVTELVSIYQYLLGDCCGI
jgi:hypothetical protein